jgi:hypothetical protein
MTGRRHPDNELPGSPRPDNELPGSGAHPDNELPGRPRPTPYDNPVADPHPGPTHTDIVNAPEAPAPGEEGADLTVSETDKPDDEEEEVEEDDQDNPGKRKVVKRKKAKHR